MVENLAVLSIGVAEAMVAIQQRDADRHAVEHIADLRPGDALRHLTAGWTNSAPCALRNRAQRRSYNRRSGAGIANFRHSCDDWLWRRGMSWRGRRVRQTGRRR